MRPETNHRQSACKPGSVWLGARGAFAPRVTAIPLGRPSPDASSNQPERPARRTGLKRAARPCRSYSVLLPAGLAMPPTLPPARCALTAPFHPYRPAASCERSTGGLLSVALSLGSPPPDVIRRRVSVEPGLSSARRATAVQPTGALGLGERFWAAPRAPRLGLWRRTVTPAGRSSAARSAPRLAR
jgi:hypothetical protein